MLDDLSAGNAVDVHTLPGHRFARWRNRASGQLNLATVRADGGDQNHHAVALRDHLVESRPTIRESGANIADDSLKVLDAPLPGDVIEDVRSQISFSRAHVALNER